MKSILHSQTPAYIVLIFLLAGMTTDASLAGQVGSKSDETQQTALNKARAIFSSQQEKRREALGWMKQRDKPDVVAALIYALRYIRDDRKGIAQTLHSITGEDNGDDWFKWKLWLEAHPEIKPFKDFDQFLTRLFYSIDPSFKNFVYPDVKHTIRLEEITWGGVSKDGIPALTNPKLISAAKADYLNKEEPVFGIEINGDVRAYPYRIMDWHEMFNDVIGGKSVSLAYCTLCGSGILYETNVDGYKNPFIFGSSGLLYRSNKLMYDQRTLSLWNQFTGQPVTGKLVGSGIKLKILPVVTTTWVEWLSQHPDTKVLSLDTGFTRDYSPGRPYGRYFSSPDLMFPARTPDKRLQAKDKVFGLRITGVEKAWPLGMFKGGRLIHDRIGEINIILIGNTQRQTVRAYRSGGKSFKLEGNNTKQLFSDSYSWQVTESALLGPDGQKLPRLPGHLAYWFAWRNYLSNTELSQPEGK